MIMTVSLKLMMSDFLKNLLQHFVLPNSKMFRQTGQNMCYVQPLFQALYLHLLHILKSGIQYVNLLQQYVMIP